MELETINKLYLELSQITTATTAREILLQKQLAEAQKDSERLDWIDSQTYAGANPRGNVWRVGWKGHAMRGLDFRSAIDTAKENAELCGGPSGPSERAPGYASAPKTEE